ncbi:MAG: hypothetical protein A3J97_13930 [Spirochaetes bacterium RIFOXYC1_FULL_54_7]|nr:MAG: hypothetical protein A3J97_13930 [Spirochaetes bacterium RIFOXYC1_FULL_54_7]
MAIQPDILSTGLNTMSAPAASIQYKDTSYLEHEQKLATLANSGADAKVLSKLIESIFVKQHRTIRDLDFKQLDPQAIADNYLLPRKDLNRFVVENWVQKIFIAGLPKKTQAALFMFGLGRLFSTYNDLGAQHSTDIDLNLIVDDAMPQRSIDALVTGLKRLQHEFHSRFGIVLELHPQYMIQREAEVLINLNTGTEKDRIASVLFYRTNEKSIRILQDHPVIRENIFSRVRQLPDACMFEHFMGFSAGKASYAKLRSSSEALVIGLDGSCDSLAVHTVVGSRSFGYWLRRHFPQGLFVSPPEWHFSMKYFINRVYDYICAMRNAGYQLEELGFRPASNPGGGTTRGKNERFGSVVMDPDFLYIRNAHKLMLFLQELVQSGIGAYGMEVDCSWMSGARFTRLVDQCGNDFLTDFDILVLSGCLLRPSEAERYRFLQQKIKTRSKDRYLEGPIDHLKNLPEGLRYDVLNNEGSRYKISIPYTWSDLAFFAFNAISVHIAQIVEGKILPTLPRMGMPKSELDRYRKAFSEN